MTLVLILSSVLMALIITVEGINFRRTRRITFLTAVHVLIVIGYCLPPFLVAFLPDTPWQYGPNGPAYNPWGDRLYILDLAEHLRLSPGIYVSVGLILFGAYGTLAFTYLVSSRLLPALPDVDAISSPALVGSGAALGTLAVAAIGLYATQFSSFPDMMVSGTYIREGTLQAQRGYLQILGQVGVPAFFMLVASGIQYPGIRRVLLLLFAAIVWGFVVLRMLHAGGRLELGAFILAPLIGWVFTLKSPKLVAFTSIPVAALILIIASLPHEYFRHPIMLLPDVMRSLTVALPSYLLTFLAQFSFPHIAAAHTMTVVPELIELRHFIDVPLGLLYMLPNFSGVETLPPMILSLHVRLLPWIPVDLFSFGYYSLGTIGVLISFAAFGFLLALFDNWLTASVGWLGQTLRTAWLFYLPFRLFYADPYATLQSGFGLIMGTMIILGLTLAADFRTRTR